MNDVRLPSDTSRPTQLHQSTETDTDTTPFLNDVRRVLHFSENVRATQQSQRMDARADAYAKWLYNHFKWLEKHYPDFPPDACQAPMAGQD